MRPIPPLPNLEHLIEIMELMPHSRMLDLRCIELRHGVGYMRLPYHERLIGNQSTGSLHGGAITGLLDTLSGLVVMSCVPETMPVATLDLRIDHLSPGKPPNDVLAKVECYKLTRSIAFVRGLAYHDTVGDPIASCSGSFMVGGTGYAIAAARALRDADAPC